MVGTIEFISGKKLMDMRVIVWIFALFIGFNVYGQGERPLIREGNKQYKENKYADAETSYRKALNKNSKSLEASFNIGNSLYKQGKYDEAAKQFAAIADSVKNNKDVLSKSYYNLGNSYFKSNKLQESANAYKNALRNNPTDMDAKFNLSLVNNMLKQQQQNKDKNQDNKDNKDNKDDKNKDQKNKDNKDNKDNKNDQQNKDQQKQDQNKQPQGGDKQQQQPQQNQISAEDAKRILDAMKNDEKAVQQKVQEQKAKEEKEKAKRSGQPEKNW
jgi:tetratricopeptide (TPR) repeat protein